MGKKLISFALTASKKADKQSKFVRDRASKKYLNLSIDKSSRWHCGVMLQDNEVYYSIPLPLAVIDLVTAFVKQYRDIPPLKDDELRRLRITKSREIEEYISIAKERAKKTDYGFKRDRIRGGAVLDKQLYVTFKRLLKGGLTKEKLNELILNACKRELEKQFNKALISTPAPAKPATTLPVKPAIARTTQPISKCVTCGLPTKKVSGGYLRFCDKCLSKGF